MEEIDLKEIFDMFWSKKVVIILVVLLFMGIGVFYTKFMVKPDYKSSAILVLTKNGESNETITQSEVTLNQKLIGTYTEVIKSDNVLRQVISNLNLDIDENELRNRVSVKLVLNTQLIEISVTNENPETAKLLTNEITNVFMDRVKEIYKINNISIFSEANLSTGPYNINHTKNVLMFIVIGIVIAFGCVFIASMFDTTVKTAEEAEKKLGVTVLASIPNCDYETKKKGKK